MGEFNFYHSFEIRDERCDGRMGCVRTCPTRALRVYNKKVTFLNDLCIDCGQCIEICSEKVFVPLNDTMDSFKSFKYHVAMPSNVLYIQFGPDLHPGIVNMALRRIGFDAIADVSGVCDEVGYALYHHLQVNPTIRPLISSFCPSIVRLIQVGYPTLVKHIEPLNVPREITARETKRHYARKLGLKEEEIGVIYIAPCPAKVVSIKQPAEKGSSWIDGAIPIKDIYNLVLPEIIKMQQEGVVPSENDLRYGKAWGVLGHYSQNVGGERALSVAGISHVKVILEDIESDKLRDLDFIEALACIQGCTNGLFCVKNPYMARHNSIQLQKKYGRVGSLDKEKVVENYEKGYYFYEGPVLPRETRSTQVDLAESIKRIKKKERIYAKLPKNDCNLCGAPTCETFAEDCARNEADITDCVFFGGDITGLNHNKRIDKK
jgi:iron only hydrogenase large subunit-like protein